MGERTRTDLQRGMAYVEGWPVAGSCRTASYRHNHRKGNQDSGSCRRTLRPSFLVGPKKGFGSTIRPPRGLRSQSSLDHCSSRIRGGSGRNGRRPKLIKLLANPKIQTMVVEHRDRLMRFGAEYVEAALTAQERKLLVMESSEVNGDLVQDMIEVLTSFCARLYGSRSARHKAKKSTARHGALKHYDHQKQKANASRDTCGKQSDRRKIHIKLCAKKGARVPRALFRHVWGRKTYALAVAAIAFG